MDCVSFPSPNVTPKHLPTTHLIVLGFPVWSPVFMDFYWGRSKKISETIEIKDQMGINALILVLSVQNSSKLKQRLFEDLRARTFRGLLRLSLLRLGHHR